MWTYILRRVLLMIPTLLGVTIVSFAVMQAAPGDPIKASLGPGGAAGQSLEARDAYLLRKRELKLDKPWFLNFRYFTDYSEEVRQAAWFMGHSEEELADVLPPLASGQVENAEPRLNFLRSLDWPAGAEDFEERLASDNRVAHESLAQAALLLTRVWLEDAGAHGVPPALEIVADESAPLRLRIGAIKALDPMVVDPLHLTYSRHPQAEETPVVQAYWRLWYERLPEDRRRLSEARRVEQAAKFHELSVAGRGELFEMLESFDYELSPRDMPYFAERLLDEDSTLKEQVVAAIVLKLYVPRPIKLDVPLDAGAAEVREVAENWGTYYRLNAEKYSPSFPAKVGYIVADTQYAHMVWRLATFEFGSSALKTKEPVGELIWDAFLVSAPLMIMAEILIYLIAVPIGVVCAVSRGGLVDRALSLLLFFLYSIPPFVAGMLFLLFFAYGQYLDWFPMGGLHSQGAENWDFGPYLLDYLWHAALPVICLTLFSLAALSMYARTSMLDVLGQDYVRTARAKGVKSSKVVLKHALRNGMIPIITLFSNTIPAVLGGSVLIEVIFNIPGMGRLGWASIEAKDFPTLMALIYVQAIVVMVSILLSDLLYVVVDPRISFQGRGKAA